MAESTGNLLFTLFSMASLRVYLNEFKLKRLFFLTYDIIVGKSQAECPEIVQSDSNSSAYGMPW